MLRSVSLQGAGGSSCSNSGVGVAAEPGFEAVVHFRGEVHKAQAYLTAGILPGDSCAGAFDVVLGALAE